MAFQDPRPDNRTDRRVAQRTALRRAQRSLHVGSHVLFRVLGRGGRQPFGRTAGALAATASFWLLGRPSGC
jgi:hypothetical protein